jgi:hypothetical protein
MRGRTLPFGQNGLIPDGNCRRCQPARRAEGKRYARVYVAWWLPNGDGSCWTPACDSLYMKNENVTRDDGALHAHAHMDRASRPIAVEIDAAAMRSPSYDASMK